MAPIDREIQVSAGLSTAVNSLGLPTRLCTSALLVLSSLVFCVSQSRAQDVAEAARQERARKESQPKKQKHVYTNDDLKHARILTPEDRAQVEARKNQPAPAAPQKSSDARQAIDAQSLPAGAPLGDVARELRRQKESRRLGRSGEFHLPVADTPALASTKPPAAAKPLASPKPPVQPLRPPVLVPQPAPPRLAPYQPPVKRSPFERPRVFRADPPLLKPSHPPSVRRAPVVPNAPSVPALRANPLPPATAPSQPPKPIAPVEAPKANMVTVQPGDSLWKLAEQNLGYGARWHELLSLNPAISDPNHIVAGSRIYLPASVSPLRPPTKITVRKGDTLSQIAQTYLGHASCAACIAHANPAIRDVNLIYEGQVLLLPASCRP